MRQRNKKANVIKGYMDRGLVTGQKEETAPLLSTLDHTESAIFRSTMIKEVSGKTGVCSKVSGQYGREIRNRVLVSALCAKL